MHEKAKFVKELNFKVKEKIENNVD